jgi:hypothetical protein
MEFTWERWDWEVVTFMPHCQKKWMPPEVWPDPRIAVPHKDFIGAPKPLTGASGYR